MKKKATIIDYGMGNLRSVANALEILDYHVCISKKPSDILDASHVILPGVGAFKNGMAGLLFAGWDKALSKTVASGQPLLGICLGLQLLADQGTENGVFPGLGFVSGEVTRLSTHEGSYRIPHMGWNDVEFSRGSRLFSGLGERQAFYFVHSYILKPENPKVTAGWCHHSEKFTAAVEFENIFATQFHPEKSQHAGLAVLKNFMEVE